MTEAGKARVVVVGGGYAGAAVARTLDDAAAVTLVEPREAFVHNVAAWRALVEPEWLERIFFPYDGLLANGRVVRDRVLHAEPRQVRLASGEVLPADVLVLATGSRYPFPAKSQDADMERARERYRAAHADLRRAGHVLVLGAGPAGLELAGEVKAFYPEKQVTVVDPGEDILAGPFKPALRGALRRQLDELGIRLLLRTALADDPPTPPATLGAFEAVTEAGDRIEADLWYRAFGVQPVTDYLGDALATARDEAGRLRVTPELRVEGHERVFAVGDVSTAGSQMAASAGVEAETAAANVRALIEGDPLVAFEPLPPAIFVPLGPNGGAGQLPGAEEISGPEAVAEIKGEHMFVERYAEQFGVRVPAR
jgi:apoptosis-inducing factor 2